MTNETNSLNVAFFGTSDKSEPILKALYSEFNLCLCVTKSDTKVGRNRDIRQTGVKKWALGKNVHYIEVDNLKDRKNIDTVKKSLLMNNVDIAIVADFSYIIPLEIIQEAKYGMINVHFSLLPKYRGASPVQQSLLNGDEYTGVTFILMDEGMDTGDILTQRSFPIEKLDTTASLYDKLFIFAADLLPQTIQDYVKNIISPKEQDHASATYCYSPTHPKSTYIYRDDARINWSKNVNIINNMIRAYFPWPVCWSTLQDMRQDSITLTSEGIILNNDKNTTNAFDTFDLNVKNNKVIKIYEAEINNSNVLVIKRIQVEGKNITDWKSFLSGYSSKRIGG
ncbi:hypothetical protein H6802_01730 [Candidatus Nomurabacteria bacterium]|uniref:Methionyl-tRNA formyltransferase n=1 Tax=candidate division WWE3 bacterium TaxID=2053526 RepID=A0A955IWE9_UNCKA|nr:hypothetical protein [candidate division WWE3 bacterium]MCB9823651.1 hypothetical protein [Candidatus Nomurabacteria bacterium]MCB9827271.1 hypothetical protein [Candidatus Nomurabacteria bacterium]MCB9827446.1 hypothetical protein [Candidatus Nomurabacteria bacterium]HXK52777.1 methionyl-tRNA formyltransferase [bacterium]